MKSDIDFSERDLEALIERGRTIRPVADVVRARALARAKETVAAGMTTTPAPEMQTTTIGRGPGLRIAIAASFVLLAGAAGAVAAIRSWTPERPAPTPPSSPRATLPAHVTPRDVGPPAAPVAPVAAPSPRAHRGAPPVTPQESYRAELDLLQRAQVAYAARDFSGALVLVADHARRFPNGRLAEEREALRVRSLVGSGRRDEAQRAAERFANRFPRSVLLPKLRQAAGTPD